MSESLALDDPIDLDSQRLPEDWEPRDPGNRIPHVGEGQESLEAADKDA